MWGISNLLRSGRRGSEVIVTDRCKGEGGSEKHQIERYVTVVVINVQSYLSVFTLIRDKVK